MKLEIATDGKVILSSSPLRVNESGEVLLTVDAGQTIAIVDDGKGRLQVFDSIQTGGLERERNKVKVWNNSRVITAAPVELAIERLAAVDGDYDAGGAYWGTASEIWCAHGDGVQVFVRADDLARAQAGVRKLLPAATFTDAPAFLAAYIRAALWSSIDDNGDPLEDNHSASDLAPATLAEMEADCEAFQTANAALLDRAGDAEQNGHDFWLTRCRHGAGFWDRGYPDEVGDALTEAAHSFGECNLYAGDDGLIYA